MAAKNNADAPYKDFAERLMRLRKEAGLTRVQLAEQVGISDRTIINYESGKRIPFGDTCVKLANVFDITTDELLGKEKSEAEMAKARIIDDMGRLFGNSSANSAQAYLDGTNALLAGGTLSTEEQLDFITVMHKVLIDAEIHAKEKYTPSKFKTPDWKEHINKLRTAADEIINEEE